MSDTNGTQIPNDEAAVVVIGSGAGGGTSCQPSRP